MTRACPLRAMALGFLLAGGAAWAEVRLETDVSKVETTLDGRGEARRELVPAEEVVPGEELRYTISFHNDSDTVVDAERIVITNPVPDGTVYVLGSAGGEHSLVEYSVDGETFEPVEPAASADGPQGPAPAAAPASGGDTAPSVKSLRWTYQQDLEPGDTGEVYFHVRML